MFRKLLTLTVLAPISSVFAGGMGDLASAPVAVAPVACEQRAWEIGPEVFGMNTNFRLTDDDGDTASTKIRGAMFGLSGSYTYRDELFARLEMSGAWGRQKARVTAVGLVDTNDEDIDELTTFTASNKVSVWKVEPRVLLGYDNAFELGSAKFTPFTGAGWRHTSLKTKNAGKTLKANTVYIPVGMEVHSCLDNGWSLGVNGEADFAVVSRVDSFNTGFNWGLRGAVTLAKDFGDFSVGAEPFVKFWNAGSKTKDGVKLHRVRSTEIGGKIKFAF